MVCSHATYMISEGVLAMGIEATAEDIARLMHPHPTVSEALMEAANAAVGKAIHMLCRRKTKDFLFTVLEGFFNLYVKHF